MPGGVAEPKLPVARQRTRAGLAVQHVAGLELVNPLADRVGRRHVSVAQVLAQRGHVDADRHQARAHDRLQTGLEEQPAIADRVKERLDAEAIAGDNALAAWLIPQRDREDAVQARYEARSLFAAETGDDTTVAA